MRGAVAVMCVAVLLLPGCAVPHHVSVTGRDLFAQIAALRAHGVAVVPAMISEDGKRPRPSRETIRLGQRLQFEGGTLTVRQLIDGCGELPDRPAGFEPTCMLVLLAGDTFRVRTFTTRSLRQAVYSAATVVVLGSLLAAAICEGACAEDSKPDTASEITLGVGAGLFVGLIVWMFIDCAGRWGSPGCRD